ncbi:MAG TPA: SpoIIE family protein phosphatase [Coriobacteriia bacterium]|jgi:serine phosphatase RsbU (regulator of sigma subunit)
MKTSARERAGKRTVGDGSKAPCAWSLLEGASYPAAVWSGSRLQFTWANRRFLEMLWEAQSRFDRLGMPMRGFLSDADMAVRFQDAAYTGEPYTDVAYPYRTPTGLQTYWRLSLLPVPGRLGDPYDVLLTAVDVTAEHTAGQHRRRRDADLASADGLIQRTILSTLDADEILQRALVEATEAYGADWGWIALREIDSWVFRNVHGWPAESIGRSFLDSDLSLPRLAAEANGVVMAASPSVADDRERELMARHDLGAFLLVPLYAKGEVRGVMGFCWSDPEPLDEAHRDLGEKLSLSTTLALENARAYGRERHIAKTLQSAFFAVPEHVPGVEFSHLYHSATGGASVGGDFYDIVEVTPGRIGMLIGDVSGHGVDVSALATLVRSSMHVHALQAPSPQRVLAATNDVIMRSMFGGYASAFFGLLDTSDGSLAYCSAGHPEPVLVPAAERPRFLRAPQLVLGVESEAAYANDVTSLAVGDTLLLYTDGLTEVRDPRGRQFGADRLLRAVERAAAEPLEKMPESVFLDAFSFAEGRLSDDIAILAVCRADPSASGQERLAIDAA